MGLTLMMLCVTSNTTDSDTFGEDGGLGDVKFKSSILLEGVIMLRQDLKCHTHLSFYVTIVNITLRKAPGPPGTLREHVPISGDNNIVASLRGPPDVPPFSPL